MMGATGPRNRYLSTIEELGNRANATQTGKALGVSRQAASKALEGMAADGLVHRDDQGVWHCGESPQGEMEFE